MQGRYSDIDITGLAADSRDVHPGFLFAALPGTQPGTATDGRNYIGDAINRGAVAILAPLGTRIDGDAHALVTDAEPRAALAHMAATFYAQQPAFIAAVTGTNGKSSVVGMARQLWQHLGISSASIGTLGTETAKGHLSPPGLTSPSPIELHESLAKLAKSGVSHVAIEASSHGLDQARLDAVDIRAAAFTTMGRDHLDYHGDLASYFTAKARLFDELIQPGGTAVLNADIAEFADLAQRCKNRDLTVLDYGTRGTALKLKASSPTAHGQTLDMELMGRRHKTSVQLVGGFQAHNLLAAIGLVLSDNRAVDEVADLLPRIQGIRGRMELVAVLPNGAGIFVDYAHTPDALETALRAIRPHTQKRLAVVFGAGGDRDRGKRPLMGQVAAASADNVIVTNDNPRSENAADIRAEVLAGCPNATDIGDRAAAIDAGIRALAAGDSLIIAGKGHETGQIIGDKIMPFDDRDVARDIVEKLHGTSGVAV